MFCKNSKVFLCFGLNNFLYSKYPLKDFPVDEYDFDYVADKREGYIQRIDSLHLIYTLSKHP